MKNFCKLIFTVHILIIFSFFSYQKIYCTNETAGADDAVALPESEWNFTGSANRIATYAVMDGGFTFQDYLTSCTFASLFPISDVFQLRGGTVYLNNSIYCDKDVFFSTGGLIYGNDQSFVLSSGMGSLELGYALTLTASWFLNVDVYSIDWSYDNNYIAVGTANNLVGGEVNIFSFDGTTLVRVATYELGDNVQTVRWHPLNYYLAVGRNQNPGDELYIFYFDTGTNVLSIRDSLGLNDTIDAVDWHETGTYLVVSERKTGRRVSVYEVSGGGTFVGTPAYDGGQAPDLNVGRDAICWGPDSGYIVAGFDALTTESEIIVFKFDSAANTITHSVGIKIGQRVDSVDWSPTGSFIAAGLSGGSQELRICQLHRYEDGRLKWLEDKASADVGEKRNVYSVDWRYDGNYLAIGRDANVGGTDFRIYSFDKNNVTLSLVDGVDNVGQDVYAVRWSRDGVYVAKGDIGTSDSLVVYRVIASPLVFKDLVLELNRNLYLYSPILFQGNSRLHGNGFKLLLQGDGEIIVDSATELKIRNLKLYNLEDTNLKCDDNSSSIDISNSELRLSDNFNFDKGSILFKGDTVISGTCTFCYSSGRGSTINSQIMLYLDQGLTFSYDPPRAQRDLLYMQDATSLLYLNNCTLHSTKTGMRLTRGTLFLDNEVTFSGEGNATSEAICFGNGNTNDDLSIYLLAGANLNVYGRLEYENIN